MTLVLNDVSKLFSRQLSLKPDGGPVWLSCKVLTCNPKVLGSSHTRSYGFFVGVSLGKALHRPNPRTGEPQVRHA